MVWWQNREQPNCCRANAAITPGEGQGKSGGDRGPGHESMQRRHNSTLDLGYEAVHEMPRW